MSLVAALFAWAQRGATEPEGSRRLPRKANAKNYVSFTQELLSDQGFLCLNPSPAATAFFLTLAHESMVPLCNNSWNVGKICPDDDTKAFLVSIVAINGSMDRDLDQIFVVAVPDASPVETDLYPAFIPLKTFVEKIGDQKVEDFFAANAIAPNRKDQRAAYQTLAARLVL